MPQSNRKKYYTIATLQLYGPEMEPQFVFEGWVEDYPGTNHTVGVDDYPEIKKLYDEDKLKIISDIDETMTIKAKFTEKEFLIWRLKNSHWLTYEQ